MATEQPPPSPAQDAAVSPSCSFVHRARGTSPAHAHVPRGRDRGSTSPAAPGPGSAAAVDPDRDQLGPWSCAGDVPFLQRRILTPAHSYPQHHQHHQRPPPQAAIDSHSSTHQAPTHHHYHHSPGGPTHPPTRPSPLTPAETAPGVRVLRRNFHHCPHYLPSVSPHPLARHPPADQRRDLSARGAPPTTPATSWIGPSGAPRSCFG